MQKVSDSPPRAPPIKYSAPLGTRWAKEKAAAGGATAFDLPTDPVAIGPWVLGECVGKGASGRVKIAKHRHTGQLAAVKILPIAPLVNSRTSLATQQAKSDKQRLGIDREIIMMKLMNHPNIMRIYDVYENDNELFLVLEYVEGGELFDFLVNRGRLPSAEALIYFRQIVYGLNYAHTFSIIHRDLKPENILISSLSPPLIKIADWGMAAFAPPALHLETSCGSPHYASPEIVNGEKYQGHATDVWSCGVILFALLTGRLPFDDKNVRTLLSKVKTGKYDMPSWIDPLAKDLLRKMLVVKVQDRISIPDILQHPWLSSQPSISFSATDGKNYSILPPPLPPSPTLLASPLASPDMIDLELFSSLKVIWGRHVDPKGDSIRRDLCSPSGEGVHTKAFYFLLGKYREETLKIDADNVIKDIVMNDATADQTTRPSTPSDQLTDGLRRYQVSNSYISPSTEPPSSEVATEELDQSASVSLPIDVIIGPPPQAVSRRRTITDGASEERTQHVKPELWKVRMLSSQRDGNSSGSTRPRSSLGEMAVQSGLPRPQPRRGHTSAMLPSTRKDLEPPSSAPVTTLGFSHHLHQLQSRTPTTATSPASQRYSSHASSVPIDNKDRRREISPWRPTTCQSDPMDVSPRRQQTVIDRTGSLPWTFEKAEVPLPLALPDNHFVRKTMDSLAQKANDLVQGTAQVPSHPTVPKFVPGSVDAAESRLSKSFRSKAKIDKENQGLETGWSHVKYSSAYPGSVGLGVGGGLGNRDVGNAPTSPSKARKEKEKKFRPPPLDLPSLNPKRSAFGMLGSPISLSSPVNAPTSANRILASPVVGEFKGWFSNLFGWKNSSHNGGVLYSSLDLQTTQLGIVRVLEGLGALVTNTHSPTNYSAPPENSSVLYCRIDQPAVDPSSGIPLKAVRFKVEIRGAGFANEQQTVMLPIDEDNPYFVSAPPATPGVLSVSSPVTPIHPFNAGGGAPMISSSRPRNTLLLGGRSSLYGTPLPSPGLPGSARWDSALPAGCLCAVALVHEKGSTSTFRLIWKKVKEECGGAYGAYPCFSPAIPNTPHEGHRSMMV